MSEPTIRRRALTETVVPGRRLGRNVVHDPRSLTFTAERAAEITSVDHSTVGLPLDQGNVGSCTANALCGALNSDPDHGEKTYVEADAVQLYVWETTLEGEPYPAHDPGGSGLEVCKAARKHGLIHSYAHAFGLQHALEALTLRPVISGFNWYTSFDQPDADGLIAITPDATVRGGHEVVAVGIDVDQKLVKFVNSWGPGYGVGGRFQMSFDTWRQLLAEDGDVTVPLPLP